jgi:hypothetical protein
MFNFLLEKRKIYRINANLPIERLWYWRTAQIVGWELEKDSEKYEWKIFLEIQYLTRWDFSLFHIYIISVRYQSSSSELMLLDWGGKYHHYKLLSANLFGYQISKVFSYFLPFFVSSPGFHFECCFFYLFETKEKFIRHMFIVFLKVNFNGFYQKQNWTSFNVRWDEPYNLVSNHHLELILFDKMWLKIFFEIFLEKYH